MKKVLVTGAAGTLGIYVIKYLLSEGKYEVTGLDLRNTHSYKRLKRYETRVNLVYGDVNDEELMSSLVKNNDIIIHLAGVIPPMADIREELCEIIDYEGTVNIVDNIIAHNPKAYLIYPSTTTVYGKTKELVSLNSEVNIKPHDLYAKAKYDAEEYIKNNLKNYTIYRIPGLLCNPKTECPMYNTPLNSKVELIDVLDASYALVKSIDHQKELNKKTYILSGGEKCRTDYKEYLREILRYHGISFRYIISSLFADKNFYGAYYEDNDLDKLLNYRGTSIKNYYINLENNENKIKRFIPKLLAKPFIIALNSKKEKVGKKWKED